MLAGGHDVPAGTAGEGEGETGQDDDGLDDVAPFDVRESVVLQRGDGEQRLEEFLAGLEAARQGHGVQVALALLGDGSEEGEVVTEDVDG